MSKRRQKNSTLKVAILILITILGFYAFLHLNSTPIHKVNADDRDLIVTGGELGTNYTYDNGILRFITDGNYTLSMRDGVAETSNRIEIDHNANMNNLNLTLDNLNLNSEQPNFRIDPQNAPSDSELNINFNLKGNTSFKANSTTYSSSRNRPNLKISAINGNDSITFIAKNSEGSINNKSFTIESGKVITQNTNITSDKGPITINGGEITINSTDSNGAIYSNTAFIMNGGNVTANTTSSVCVHIPGNSSSDGDGIKILGGNFTCNATGTATAGAFTVGPYKNKNIVIDTDGKVIINHNALGILARQDSSITMNKGILQINGGIIGIYIYETNKNSTININGGETEISSSIRAIGIRNSNKKLNIASAYVHKSYDGENAESREYVTDENTIINTENGNSKKYVLITPAWPITYDLDGGTLAEDESNPEFYSRVDSFKLNNPTKEAHDFTGWTGTGLNQATTEVTIAEGSNGARNYKANWYNPSQKDDSDEKEKDNNDYRVLPAKDDNNNTESPNTSDTTNPIFYMAVVGGSLLILIGLFVQGKELIKR